MNIFKYQVEEAGSESQEKGYFTLTRVQNFNRILNNRKTLVILVLIFFLPPPVQWFLSIVAINIFKYRVEEAGSESREKGYFT